MLLDVEAMRWLDTVTEDLASMVMREQRTGEHGVVLLRPPKAVTLVGQSPEHHIVLTRVTFTVRHLNDIFQNSVYICSENIRR